MFRRTLAFAIDEAAGLMLLHKVLRFGNRHPVIGSPDLVDWERGHPSSFFAPRPAPADLANDRREIQRTRFAVVEDFSFPSPVSTPFTRNNAVRGRQWRSTVTSDAGHSSQSPTQSTLVLIDGLVQFGYGSERLFADRLNALGIDVVTIDMPFNHHRTPEGYRPGQLIVGGNLDHTLGVLRQAVLDTWSLVRGLQAGGCDVALAGISFGGWTVLSTALVASDLAGVTAIAPPVDMLRVLTEGGVIVRAARRSLDLSPADFQSLRVFARAVTPSAWPPPLPSDRIVLHAADFDRFVPTRRIAELAELWQANLVRHPVGHLQLTCFPRWLTRVANAMPATMWPRHMLPPR